MFKAARMVYQRPRFSAAPRFIPIDVVNKLRYDPLWQETIDKLERGKLGLGIRYAEVAEAKPVVQVVKEDAKKVEQIVKTEVREVEQAVKDEVSDLKAEVNAIKAKVNAVSMGSEVKTEVRKIGVEVKQLKEAVKTKRPARKASNSSISTIQISKDFKKRLKILKGKKTYEEFIKEQMKI